MGTRVETSQSESVTRRERVSHSETNIERERRPDGTVSERETTRTESRVIEVEIKRVFTQAREEYKTRKVEEAHAWTNAIRTPEGWSSFAKEIENRYPTKAKRWTGGVFKWAEEPIDQCMENHKKIMQGLVDSLTAQKPKEMTVSNKATWIQTTAKEMEPLYPTAAYAFRVIGNVFEGAEKVKAEDIHNQSIYEKHKQNGTLPMREFSVPTLSKNPAIMSLKRRVVKVPCGPPVPNITYTSEELLEAKNAWEVYSSYETKIASFRRSYTALADQIPQMAEFVENFMDGNFDTLFNHMMSVQLSRRVLNGLKDPPTPQDFSDVHFPSWQDGLWNEYSQMQGQVSLPFDHPDLSVNISWVKVCANYKDKGKYELILPDHVAMRVFGKPVFAWHLTQHAPAVVKYNMQHRDTRWEEKHDGCVNNQMILAHVYQSPEFAPVRALQLQEKKIQEQEAMIAGRHAQRLTQATMEATAALNRARGVIDWDTFLK